ncbi:MAG: hypothetical protein D3924_03980 [Candidatus Electrothrix sp. AR4]|nr:hypothetical protein [Candidatus Electrothrix sp. AR4]
MKSDNISIQKKRNFHAFLLLSALICLIYSNTLNSSWHLDDGPNILFNPSLHLNDLRLTSLANILNSGSVFSQSKLYRPISCFTFALNWYFSQDDTTGYHIVNIAVHIITAFFLFLVLLQIMRKVDATGEGSPKNYFIALLGAALWASAPIQTQAVTYIIQRMASLAAMFTILSIYSYLKARTEENYIRWGALCILFFVAGIGSKENTVMLPASLLLLEFSFFTHQVSKQKIACIALASSLVLLAGLSVTHFILGKNLLNIFNPTQLLDSYAHRPFTFSERILTEPRIVLMYLSQIILPLVSRLSVTHDIALSTSLFTPWTTLPAILTIFTLPGLSIIFLKRYPQFAFPILFFFLNHMVESTILPLELIFEHRNYLPSIFIFLPVSYSVAQTLYASNKFSFVGRFVILSGTTCYIIISGHATYIRNLVWVSESTLWTDAIRKAPLSARAYGFLGQANEQIGEYRKAFYYYTIALQHSDTSANPKLIKTGALNKLGSIHYTFKKYEEALHCFAQCLELDESHEDCLKNRARSYLQLGLPQPALNDAKNLLERYPESSTIRYIAASAAYRTGDLAAAQKHIKQTIRKALNRPDGLHLMGIILLKYKSYPNSLFFLKRAVKLSPNTAEFQLALAVAYYTNNQIDAAEKTLYNILARHPLPILETALQNSRRENLDKEALNFLEDTLTYMIGELSSSLR